MSIDNPNEGGFVEKENQIAKFKERLASLYEKNWVRKDPIPLDNQNFLVQATRQYTQQWYAVKFSLIGDMIKEAEMTGDDSLLEEIEVVLKEFESIDHNKEMQK